MSNALFQVPNATNEPIYTYAPGTDTRKALKMALKDTLVQEKDIPMIIGGKTVTTKEQVAIHLPHALSKKLGFYHKGGKQHVRQAIDAALQAKRGWEHMPWEERAAIFLRAADMMTGRYRAAMNAATMQAQSKNVHQAEIDCVCEFADFLRFNAEYLTEIYREQPNSAPGMWNRMDYRPLEGFVCAITPFNFTSIAGNLPTCPAMAGNTVVWKPSSQQIYSAYLIMEILQEAGLPDGVINLIYTDGPAVGDVVFRHPDFAGIHFTGSTGTFQFMWQEIGKHIKDYKSYPRIVGETGGKDFVVAHPSAPAQQVVTALSRAAFEYQGQKCSAASRAYLPKSLWPEIKEGLIRDLKSFKMGPPDDFSNFINAVIDEAAYKKITGFIKQAKKDDVEIIAGGNFEDAEGYFIEPTVIVAEDPHYTTMEAEIFGPVLTVYVYDDNKYAETLELVDNTSPYALTGAVFARDRQVIEATNRRLRHAAGNFYINDKPTAAVVGQQPFGGARGSGTNDKAGSKMNLYRWLSARSLKETYDAPTDYRYPFMKEKS